jgi:hypothetical protein
MSTFGAIPVRALSLTDTGIYTFSNLGVNADLVFNGPYDANTIRFGLPPTWQLQDGAELDLSISSYFTANNVPSADNSSFSGALLNVYFNDKLQQSIPLVSGKAVNYQIPISSDALNSPDSSGRHKISFFLDASIDCRLDFHKTTVIVSSTSKILFPHADKALSLDLRRLPWPIYQDNNVEKVSAVVVVPETASADELQAGLVAAGAFGRMTGGKLPLTLISNDQLTDAIKSQSNIILVGKPSAFPELGGAAMTVPIVGGKYVLPDLKDDDGILQVVVSPWNSSNVLLAVSGNTDQGVVKAAQALSTSNIQTADAPNYSIISTVNPIATTGTLTSRLTPIPSSDASLSDLGYEAINSSGIGSNWMSVEFDVPSGQAPADGAYIDLKYSTSALTDVNRSSGDIYLNNVLIGSLNFSSTDSNIITSRINLPMSILRSGTNNLDINVNLLPKDSCSVFAFSGLWITIFPDSILHLPLTPAQSASVSLQGIKLYPFPFANDSALSTTAFIVSKQDRASWSAAGRISYDLGTKISGSIIGFEAAYSDQVPDDIRTHNLIVIGEPKNLNVISDFKNTLPAYFEANSNIAVLNSLQVIYRFSGSKKLGYLELFPSPWNQTGTALGIFGTSSEGIGFAVDAILNAASRDALVGNFAVLDGNKAVVADTRTGLGLGQIESNLDSAVISTAAVPIVEPSNINQAQSEAVQNRLLIAVGVIGIVILIIAVVVFTLWRGKRKV